MSSSLVPRAPDGIKESYFWAANISRAPTLYVVSCFWKNSRREFSFFIRVTFSTMSWISDCVQIAQNEFKFLQDSCKGPSRSLCSGKYEAINVLYDDFIENPASSSMFLMCACVGSLLYHLFVASGTRCANQFPSRFSGVSVVMVNTPPGLRTLNASFKVFAAFGKDFPSGFSSKWCKT